MTDTTLRQRLGELQRGDRNRYLAGGALSRLWFRPSLQTDRGPTRRHHLRGRKIRCYRQKVAPIRAAEPQKQQGCANPFGAPLVYSLRWFESCLKCFAWRVVNYSSAFFEGIDWMMRRICCKSATSVLYLFPSAATNFSCLHFVINSSAPSEISRFLTTAQYVLAFRGVCWSVINVFATFCFWVVHRFFIFVHEWIKLTE